MANPTLSAEDYERLAAEPAAQMALGETPPDPFAPGLPATEWTSARTFYEVKRAGMEFRFGANVDRLQVVPGKKLTPEIRTAIRRHRDTILYILRENKRVEDEAEMERTGRFQSERQVFAAFKDLKDREGVEAEQETLEV